MGNCSHQKKLQEKKRNISAKSNLREESLGTAGSEMVKNVTTMANSNCFLFSPPAIHDSLFISGVKIETKTASRSGNDYKRPNFPEGQ